MKTEEPAFKIKTGNLPVLKLHLLTPDIPQLQKELASRLEKTPDFFANTPIVLELSAISGLDAIPDFPALKSFMLEHRMCAAVIVGGSDAQRDAAAAAGLVQFPAPTAKAEPVQRQIEQQEPEIRAPLMLPTQVVDKPVRTGQRIYAEGANLVVLAIVNAGAELIADGDIHVYAPMRGRAIAGARGNESARIFMQGMEAELLSIAGCFKVLEDEMPENVRAKPAQVRLEGSRLLIEPMHK